MRSPSLGTALRSHCSPKIPTSASQGTLPCADEESSAVCERACASASATVASSGSKTCHNHCREGVANATVHFFI
jgi:hypothetical protein